MAFIIIRNISKNVKLQYLLLLFINLIIITKFNITFIPTLFDNFKNVNFIINLILLLALIYSINELLNFTNISKSLDFILINRIQHFREYIYLFLSSLSSNFDFSSSKVLDNKNFYNNGFLMSSINIFSILSLEILFLLVFIDQRLIGIWVLFIIANFFTFIWISKKILDIKNKNIQDYNFKEYFNNVFLNKNKSYKELNYNEKYNISFKHSLPFIITSIFLTIIVSFILKITIFSSILLFLLIIFIALFIYIYYLIYKTSFIDEKTFYIRLFSNLKYLANHIIEIVLALILLHSNLILFSIFNGSNNISVLLSLIITLIYLIIITLMSFSYLLPLTMIIPLLIISFNYSTTLSVFFISLVIFIFYYKSIAKKDLSITLIKEFSIISLGGIISFILLNFFNYFIVILFLIIYIFLMSKFYNKLFLKDKNDGN